MRLTVLKVDVGNPAKPTLVVEVGFLLDSGIMYAVLPARILKRLGIKPLTTEKFRLADGTTIRRERVFSPSVIASALATPTSSSVSPPTAPCSAPSH